jgi:Xaa-Pro aminopeptidase
LKHPFKPTWQLRLQQVYSTIAARASIFEKETLMFSRVAEVQQKLQLVRHCLTTHNLGVVSFRNTSWFSWITAGGSSRVLMGAEQGIAEVHVTANEAFVVTDNIEALRLEREELPQDCFELKIFGWAQSAHRNNFASSLALPQHSAADMPSNQEQHLPTALLEARRVLCAGELERFPEVGRLAAQAMSEAMRAAQSDWTEQRLASVGADALLRRGLIPEVILVAGEDRLPMYRHPLPTDAKLKRRAMMVFCAQRYGLIANLTRFIEFGSVSLASKRQHQIIHDIEADILDDSKPGVALSEMYQSAARAYSQHGFAEQIHQHHQGGIGGYRPRELFASPETNARLQAPTMLTWNPSIPGAKIEDSFLLHPNGSLENLTFDPHWNATNVRGRSRPLVLELGV